MSASIFERIVSRLPVKLQPLAKALFPFVGTILAVAVQFFVTGEFDKAELVTTLTGISAAVITFLFPNIPPGDVDPASGQVEGAVNVPRATARRF